MFKKCEFCGKDYETHNSKSKYCSISCSNKGRNHKNVKCNCDVCGKEIEIVYSRYLKNNHHYCSIECLAKGKKLFYTGKNNPLYDKVIVKCEICNKEIEINKYRYKHQKHFYCSYSCKYKGNTIYQSGENNSFYGKYHSDETKNKISQANQGNIAWNKGYKAPWKTDEEREKDRSLYGDKYKEWRNEVFARDNYTCQCCGSSKGGNLNAHHLNGYAWCKDERLNVDNGITLCKECHRLFHSIYGKGNNTIEQFKEFIINIKDA